MSAILFRPRCVPSKVHTYKVSENLLILYIIWLINTTTTAKLSSPTNLHFVWIHNDIKHRIADYLCGESIYFVALLHRGPVMQRGPPQDLTITNNAGWGNDSVPLQYHNELDNSEPDSHLSHRRDKPLPCHFRTGVRQYCDRICQETVRSRPSAATVSTSWKVTIFSLYFIAKFRISSDFKAQRYVWKWSQSFPA